MILANIHIFSKQKKYFYNILLKSIIARFNKVEQTRLDILTSLEEDHMSRMVKDESLAVVRQEGLAHRYLYRYAWVVLAKDK